MTRPVASPGYDAALAVRAGAADLRSARARLGDALPREGWLADYLKVVTPMTDAPPEFHLISGMCALATAAGNRLYTESWGQNVFPHLWAVLVAPSSFWRKSTAIGQAERMLHAAGRAEGAPGLVFPSDFTREKLVKLLAEQPSGFMAQKEFGGFLSLLGREYMSGSKEMLTDLYDGPDVYIRALQKEVVEVRRPALTLLGATTLDWLESKITDGDLRGGFLARFLFVTARQKSSPKGMTTTTPEQRHEFARLATFVRGMAELPPTEVTFSPDAQELLNEWALGWEAEVGGTHHPSDLSGFAVRLQTYALKFAMIYRLSAVYREQGAAHLVDEAAVHAAIAYCRTLWSSVAGLIDDQIAITKDAKELRRVRAIVGSGITRSEALKLSKMRAREFDQLVGTLIEAGLVSQVKTKASEVGLDRQRDSVVTWLSPVLTVGNGHHHGPGPGSLEFPSSSTVPPLAVPSGSQEFRGEPEESGNSRELEGPSPRSESPSSSTSTVLLSDTSRDDGYTRARGTAARRPVTDVADPEDEL